MAKRDEHAARERSACDLFPRQRLRDEESGRSVRDHPVAIDTAHVTASRIFPPPGRWDIGAPAGREPRRRRPQLQRLMRAHLIVFIPEGRERSRESRQGGRYVFTAQSPTESAME